MNAGDLRARVALQTPIDTKDPVAGHARTWAHIAYLWVGFERLTSNEQLFQGTLDHRTTHKIVCRYHEGVKKECRLVWGSRAFYIQQVLDYKEEHRNLVLFTEERE